MPPIPTLTTRAIWVVVIASLIVDPLIAMRSEAAGDTAVAITTAVLFPLLIFRLVLAARTVPARRRPLLLLAASAAVWAVGVYLVRHAPLETPGAFPLGEEWIFLLSYLGIIGYLTTEPDRRRVGLYRAWLEVVVLCGAAWCVATLLLVLPVRIVPGVDGATLLHALVYPFVDLLLGLIVLSQVALNVRSDRQQALLLLVAFGCLGVADATLALNSSASGPDSGHLSALLWVCAWVILTTAACRPPRPGPPPVQQNADPRLLIAAGAVAVVVLAAPLHGTVAWYAVPPAVVTLVAIGIRLAFALRDATHVTSAVELARTDDLTALPNRRAMHARLARALQNQRPFGLMVLDLNGFKEINDSLGHHAGDGVLRSVALRMRAEIGDDAMVARLGGDEFALLLDTDDQADLVRTAHRLLEALAGPITIDGIAITPAGSIGIAVPPLTDPPIGRHELLRRADVAMYQAKTSQSGAALYDPRLDEFSRARLQLSEDLRHAVSAGQIEVWYQPQLDVRTGQITAAEALVRWRHPEHGVLDPQEFLPSARRIGLMGELAAEVTEHAVRDLGTFLREGLDLRVSVNCAPNELVSTTFLPGLVAALTTADIPTDRLVIEVTEESFLIDADHAQDLLADIRQRGIEISIDDFGTGFSSLTHLRTLPASELKIDRSLIRAVGFDERSLIIVSSTIQMAHALGLRTVAEGVESDADVRLLTDLGIDCVQGYLIGGPMPAEALITWLRERAVG